jgi:hypothetical protein
MYTTPSLYFIIDYASKPSVSEIVGRASSVSAKSFPKKKRRRR